MSSAVAKEMLLAVFIKSIKILILDSRIFCIIILPCAIFMHYSVKLEISISAIVAKLETYIGCGAVTVVESRVVFRSFLFIPLLHYLLAFMYKSLLSFFFQTMFRSAYKAYLVEYLSIKYRSFHKLGSGQIHVLLEKRTTAMVKFANLLFLNFFTDTYFVVSAMLRLFQACDYSILAFLLVQLVLYTVVSYYGTVLLNNIRKKYNTSCNQVNNSLYNTLQIYDVVKSYNNDNVEVNRLDKPLRHLERNGQVYRQMLTTLELIQKLLFLFTNCFVVYGLLFWDFFPILHSTEGFKRYSLQFFSVRQKFVRLSKNICCFNEYYTDIVDTRIYDAGLDNVREGMEIDAFSVLEVANAEVEINDITILKKMNVVVRGGEKVAITGKNGCGKSSFVKVLLRFIGYRGSIKINGIEMCDLSKVSVRELISYVPQNPNIFDGTVLENLMYGCTLTSDSVYEMCKKFGTHELFSSLKDGYLTKVGEGGKFLSGGQKQKMSFMRAVLKDAPIFILDEPTSNLDVMAERELRDTLFTLLREKTVFFIVHNHELLEGFDKILGFGHNTITTYESFDEFYKNKELY